MDELKNYISTEIDRLQTKYFEEKDVEERKYINGKLFAYQDINCKLNRLES